MGANCLNQVIKVTMPRIFTKVKAEPRLPWNNITLVNAYALKLPTLSVRAISVKITPLLKITIYPHPNVYHRLLASSKTVVIIGSNYWKNCLRKKQASIHRQPILQCLSSWAQIFPKKCIINLALLPTSVLVPSSEIVNHLTFLFQKKLIFDKRSNTALIESNNNKNDSTKNFDIRGSPNCFSNLFPFDYYKWIQYMTKKNIFKNFSNSYGTYTAQAKINSRGLWIMAHHYKIHYSKQKTNLSQDLASFLAILSKFNFLHYFSQRAVSAASRKKAQANCIKLIRILKWRCQQSEEYLIFLLRTFQHEDFLNILQDFNSIYHSISKTKAKTKQQVSKR